jgi:ParB family chromosome partitioning protein
MSKKPVLGKGLGALIPVYEGKEESLQNATYCAIDQIDPNPAQPRKSFDEEKLAALAETIRNRGILQPLVVRRKGGRYELIAGERRWRAAKLAGLERVPVVVREAEDEESLEISLLENLQREDLNPIEEARAYRHMLERLGLTQEDLARKVGKDRSSVANSVRLLQLPREVQEEVASGTISEGHARALLALTHPVEQIRAVALIKEKGLSVRDTERYVRQHKAGPGAGKGKSSTLDPDIQRVQDDLSNRLGMKVTIQKRGKGGRLLISYGSLEQLDRLCSLLLG